MGEDVALRVLAESGKADEDESLFQEERDSLVSGRTEFAREAAELAALPRGRRWATTGARVLWVAAPLFALQTASFLCITTDVVFVGRFVGTTALAAMGLAGAYQVNADPS